MKALQKQLEELVLSLLVDLPCLDHSIVIGVRCCLVFWDLEVAQDEHDGVSKNFDQTLAQKVSFTVKKAQKVANISINGLWSSFGELLQENCNVLYSHSFM